MSYIKIKRRKNENPIDTKSTTSLLVRYFVILTDPLSNSGGEKISTCSIPMAPYQRVCDINNSFHTWVYCFGIVSRLIEFIIFVDYCQEK